MTIDSVIVIIYNIHGGTDIRIERLLEYTELDSTGVV